MKNDGILNLSIVTVEDILDNVASGVYFVTADRLILYWNKAAERITGFGKNEIVGKKCPETPLRHLDDKGTNLCEGRCPLIEAIEKEKRVEKKVWVHTKNGKLKHVVVRTIPMRDKDGNLIGAVETFDDISGIDNLIKMNKKLLRLSTRDSLTHLYNKREMYFHLKKAIAASKRGKRIFVTLIDLNGFKEINDRCGHLEGDQIIKEFSNKIKKALREEDMLFRPKASRFGGDEFVVIMEISPSTSVDTLLARLEKMKRAISLKSCIGKVDMAVGITEIKKDDEAEDILERADKAMYLSKKEKRVVLIEKGVSS